MTAPWVVTLTGSLHSAIGRELHRMDVSPQTLGWFESVNQPAAILIEAPHAPEPMVFGVSLAQAGRNLASAQVPANVLAYDTGEEFTFGVTLVGDACMAEADVARAVVAAGKHGIGGCLLGQRGTYRLVGAVQEVEVDPPPCPSGVFVCHFVSPLAGVFAVPCYAELWKMARMRVLHQLDRVLGRGALRQQEYDREAEKDVELLDGQELAEQWLLHYDFFRRGPDPVVESGLIGNAVYSHCPPSHWPVLWLAAKLGIGARTSMGFGRMALGG